MAALDLKNIPDNHTVQVMVDVNNKNYLLCTLSKQILQVSLELNFDVGTEISFMQNGKGHVHLTGYLLPDEDGEGFDLEEEAGDEEASEVEESADDEAEEEETGKKRKSKPAKEKPNKKSKKTLVDLIDALAEEGSDADDTFDADGLTADDSEDSDIEEEDAASDEEADDSDNQMDDDAEESDDDNDEEEEDDDDSEDVEEEEKSPKSKKSKLQNGKSPPVPETKKEKKKNKQKENKENGSNAGNSPQKKTLQGGVHIEDINVGNGPVAKPGKLVEVYYVGRLKSNNKQFDASKSGPGFKFRLGKREVIQGWDIGVAGMKVGGKRRITCPPHTAYGAKGSPPVIPPNSTLVFEVELREVKG